ncbi:MAG: ribosome assembly RNA-binding protein YhbY [Clostridia bacterium]|nr:ribosome assembly RNA-binding protein YhbY [Clostridia bacterium]MBQ2251370.1 ribosome assembly RNA-binding protein YhbY [Clostridia bacterium]MBQ5601714.1 ribosome assembly RNA-binding protein YhbY [Clostridia bacterium]
MMTSKQRAYLRSLAMTEPVIFQVGKGGINENMIKQISDALEARELIKLRVLQNSEYTSREAAEAIAEATESAVVGVVGSTFVLYRESEKHKKINLGSI